MNCYLYDGTADGLLSAIAWILEEEPDPEKVKLSERKDTLFEEGFTISTDATQAESLFFSIEAASSRCSSYSILIHAC